MPIYEYRCELCGHEFERFQKMSDDPVDACPECEADSVKKLVSRTSFVLKGGGWYKDGYGLSAGSGTSKATSTSSEGGSTAACTSCACSASGDSAA